MYLGSQVSKTKLLQYQIQKDWLWRYTSGSGCFRIGAEVKLFFKASKADWVHDSVYVFHLSNGVRGAEMVL